MHAGEITGKGRIPYGDLSKLGCVITGLPQGLEFKQPKQYSSSELRRILDSMDKIKFLEIPDFSGENDFVQREETIEQEDSQDFILQQSS